MISLPNRSSLDTEQPLLFLPEVNDDDEAISSLAIQRLNFLASFKESSIPLTEKQINILTISKREALIANYGLKIGAICSVVTMIASMFLLLFSSRKEKTNAFIILGMSTLSTIVSFWATGIAPDRSSNAFNDKQDMLLELDDIYKNLAYKLINLYFSDQKTTACHYAKNIDTVKIQQALEKTIANKNRAKRTIQMLKDVIIYINSKEKTLPHCEKLTFHINRIKAIQKNSCLLQTM